MAHENFKSVTLYPDRIDEAAIVTRLIDGLGYRFFWATEGLRDTDYEYSPSSDCMSIGKLIKHIWGLTNWIYLSIFGYGNNKDRPADISKQRDHVLQILYKLRNHFNKLGKEELSSITIEGLPFWHIINGPLSDALTHCGQINSFRRLAGNPTKHCNVFTLK
ncbi:MAG: hypothetical protein ACFFCQ_10360 [Promethearchaeota archaeon]